MRHARSMRRRRMPERSHPAPDASAAANSSSMARCPARLRASMPIGKAYEVVAALLAEAIAGLACFPWPYPHRPGGHRAGTRDPDANLASPPTYPELAHAVFLSETKLSQGFRRLYGTSIHALCDRSAGLTSPFPLIEEGRGQRGAGGGKGGLMATPATSRPRSSGASACFPGLWWPAPAAAGEACAGRKRTDPGRNAPDFG